MNIENFSKQIILGKDWDRIRAVCLASKDPKALQAFERVTKAIQSIAEIVKAFKVEVDKKFDKMNSAIAMISMELKTEKQKRLTIEVNALKNVVLINGVKRCQQACNEGR